MAAKKKPKQKSTPKKAKEPSEIHRHLLDIRHNQDILATAVTGLSKVIKELDLQVQQFKLTGVRELAHDMINVMEKQLQLQYPEMYEQIEQRKHKNELEKIQFEHDLNNPKITQENHDNTIGQPLNPDTNDTGTTEQGDSAPAKEGA